MNRIVSAPSKGDPDSRARPDDGQMSAASAQLTTPSSSSLRRTGRTDASTQSHVAGRVEQFEVGRLDTYTRKEVLSKILRTWSDHVGFFDAGSPAQDRVSSARSVRSISDPWTKWMIGIEMPDTCSKALWNSTAMIESKP